jgi:acetylornithine deacetylase/succinyl-diaminopimelate desuccinylase-like protein
MFERLKILLPALLLGLLAQLVGAQPAVDWSKQQAETLRHFRALIQIDSSNPPGNEIKVVEYLKKVIEAEGIPTQTYALDPNRPNLVARLKGNGSKRPVLIFAHTDVVRVQREKWPVDPFGAVMKDGFIWGRGTTDDKDKLVAVLMTFLQLKRSGAQLDRDVIFLAESGEEADTTGVGIRFMVEKHFDAIDAEFSISEGIPGATIENGRVTMVQITTTEKVPRRVKLVANGTSGHGSVPRLDNALVHLGAAVSKVGTWETPMLLSDTTRTYFEKLASISPPEKAARYNGLANPQRSAEIQRYLAREEPVHYSMLHTSVVPTMLQAGVGPNVIPSVAEATVDIRSLPNEDVPKFFSELTRIIGDPDVKVIPLPLTRPDAPASSLTSEMYRALEHAGQRVYPGAVVLPGMMTAATDMALLRAKGVQSYGIGPPLTLDDQTNFGPHSDVERLPESSLYKFVEFTWYAVAEVAVKK